jgi:O-antigen ligase
LTAVAPVLTLAIGVLVLLLGAMLRQPAVLPIAAMPALVIAERVGGDAVNLSLSDMALFLAFWPAVLLAARPFSRPMRTMLWASFAYQVATIFTVVANPYAANVVEWIHAWLLVGGALVVGWAVGRAGLARLAIGLLVGACTVIALLALIAGLMQLAQGTLTPVYLTWPVGMHKNFIGNALAFAALTVYVRPRWLRWNDKVCRLLLALLILGVAVSQARQAIVGLAVAIVVAALRRDPERHRSSRLILLVTTVGLASALVAAWSQLQSDNQFNSAYQRLSWLEQSVDLWRESPWFGVGLRWWYTDRFAERFQPPNAEMEVLTSAGVIGLAAFVLMFGVMLTTLWRLDRRYGTLAFAIVLMRLVQGQFDLFWVAVQTSVPFVVAGICLGALARERWIHVGTSGDSQADVRGVDALRMAPLSTMEGSA